MSRPKERILKYELKTKNDELSNGSSVSLSDIPTSLHTFISSQKLPAFTRRGGRQAGVVIKCIFLNSKFPHPYIPTFGIQPLS